MNDVDEAYRERDEVLERLYKSAPSMRPPAPPAVARPPAPPAARGTISHGTVRAIAQGFAPVIADHVAAAVRDGVAAGVRPLTDRIGELEAEVAALKAEVAVMKDRVPHLRVV